jgi:hypothetical protein
MAAGIRPGPGQAGGVPNDRHIMQRMPRSLFIFLEGGGFWEGDPGHLRFCFNSADGNYTWSVNMYQNIVVLEITFHKI